MARDRGPTSFLLPTDWSERELHMVTKRMPTVITDRTRIVRFLPDAQQDGGHSPKTHGPVPFSALVFIAATLVVSNTTRFHS